MNEPQSMPCQTGHTFLGEVLPDKDRQQKLGNEEYQHTRSNEDRLKEMQNERCECF
jgi:hypothetical protein